MWLGAAAAVGLGAGWAYMRMSAPRRTAVPGGADPPMDDFDLDDPDLVIAEELEEDVHPEDLVGESEYSVRMASDPDRVTRVPGGLPDDEDLSVGPEQLGRHFLEEATESPAHHEPPAEYPEGDLEESSAEADARRRTP